MKQLDKWNKEIQRIQDSSELVFRDKMLSSYRDLLIDVKKEMKAYIDNYENLSFSKKLEAERLLGVSDQIQDMIMKHYGDSKDQIEKYLFTEAEQGYYGTWYALEGAENIQLSMPLINQDYIEELMFSPIDGELFSKRLYKHTEKLGKSVTNALLRGTIKGEGYASVAKIVSEETEATYKRALRIARTEGGRIQSQTKQRAYREAKRQGVDLEIQWMATLDKKTRHSHQELDGQTIPTSGYFEFNGSKAKGPRLFGKASLDINCRCTTIAVVNGFSPELRKDNETKEIIDYKNYNEWAEAKGYKQQTHFSMFNEDIRSKLSDDQMFFFEKQFNSASEGSKQVWNNFQDKLVLRDAKYNNGAHYQANNGVSMNVDEDIKGSYYSPPGNTFYHEFGHHIDFISAKGNNDYATKETVLSNGKTFGETIFKEVSDHIKKAHGKQKYERVLALKDMLKADYNDDIASMASISDLFGGATSNSLNLGIGHRNEYWKPSKYIRTKPAQYRNEQLGVEGFAEMYAATFTNEKELEKFVKWLPESYNKFEELMSILLERGG